ncbi:hypothetical protein HJFPF1_02713 [Paramyrothecium foliicola]|nr:hypothetical protein HJFPF1_02713 [Paramyrothecium foliicola]
MSQTPADHSDILTSNPHSPPKQLVAKNERVPSGIVDARIHQLFKIVNHGDPAEYIGSTATRDRESELSG